MGFGFNLFVVFILLPLTAIFLFIWAITAKKIFGIVIGIVWLSLIGLVFFSMIVQALTAKEVLEKEDFYGQYIIDRRYFAGKQANWQYNHFRFEIKKNDSILFYVTDKNKIIKSYPGKIDTRNQYASARLVIIMQQPTHHILTTNPTIYRIGRKFHLVFNSPKFNNMYFTKDEWKSIEE